MVPGKYTNLLLLLYFKYYLSDHTRILSYHTQKSGKNNGAMAFITSVWFVTKNMTTLVALSCQHECFTFINIKLTLPFCTGHAINGIYLCLSSGLIMIKLVQGTGASCLLKASIIIKSNTCIILHVVKRTHVRDRMTLYLHYTPILHPRGIEHSFNFFLYI